MKKIHRPREVLSLETLALAVGSVVRQDTGQAHSVRQVRHRNSSSLRTESLTAFEA